jgi:hypothetical protein
MFATSLSVEKLNIQPRVFKCEGILTVFIDQQHPETLNS